MTNGRPLPHPTPVTAPFWEGCRRGELLVQRCRDCGRYVFFPQAACTNCFSENLEWVRGSGRGTVYTFAVMYRAQTPAFEIPYVVAVVELEEGYYMSTNIIGCDPEAVAIGMPVEVAFERASEEITLPKFRPRAAA